MVETWEDLISEDFSVTALAANTLQVLPAQSTREWALIVNKGANDVYLAFGRAATTGTGALLKPGGNLLINKNFKWPGAVDAIADVANSVLVITQARRYLNG